MSSPLQSLGDSPQSLPTPGTERESSFNVNINNNNNNAKPTSQESYCQRRSKSAGKHRHAPYDRSPGGGSTCTSSDESSNEDGDTSVKIEQHIRKRTAANERERKRMHTVNSAFDQLRELVPTYPSTRKLSKIDTLKLACTYIQDLKALLISSQIMPQGEDVVYHPEGYATTTPSPVYPGVHVKTEYAGSDYSTCNYQPYRVQQPSYLSVSTANVLHGIAIHGAVVLLGEGLCIFFVPSSYHPVISFYHRTLTSVHQSPRITLLPSMLRALRHRALLQDLSL